MLLTGEKDGYYADYADNAAHKLGRCLAEGFAYQGEGSPYRDGEPRGEPSADLPPAAFVSFLQNHDQVGNRALGERLSVLASAARLRAATLAWLLAPQPPMLFMGEEFAARTPFLFFCDFGPDLAQAVTEGRRREFARFERLAPASAQHNAPASAEDNAIADPNDASTFEASKLDWSCLTDARHAEWLTFYKELLALRMKEIVPRLVGVTGRAGGYTVVADGALIAQWRMADGAELTLRLNLSDRAVNAKSAPLGELLRCEPPSALDAYRAGDMPAASAAWYLLEAEPARWVGDV